MQIELFLRLEALDFLIRTKSTGTPKSLARRLAISERTLYDSLDAMRDLGAPICYCRSKRTYYYSQQGSIGIRFRKSQQDLSGGFSGEMSA
ncbi:HTH domain-containing protein [Paradesertivirga mongoliensis]|uniref:HTH domain-containing protein n=1 Tax=Paradesertivirga mongoliensis TaxID=2100740 RepID=A0ABW4ZJV1_9SPHI|nr:HTH domain-containing protein [Pedobacter mongoliensis]